MWSAKCVNKIFPSQRNKNQKFWMPDGKFWSPIFLLRIRTKRMPLGPQRRFFCQKIRLNTNTLIIYTTEKPRRTNHASHIPCFVRLPNVSSQLCTFSYLSMYLLKKKCTRRKNCRLVLCSTMYVQNDLPFAFCQDDRRIAMFFAPGHYRAAFVVPVPEPPSAVW